MKINKNLLAAITDKDTIAAQAVILASFHKARNEEQYQFIELAKYAHKELTKRGINFYSDDDGESEYNEKRESWDLPLWQSLRVELGDNFSKEKLNYIIQVMNHLRETGHPDFQVKQELSQTKHPQKEPESNQNQTQVPISVIAGAVLGAGLGFMLGRPISGGLLGAAIAGGIAYSVNSSRG